MPAVAKKKGRPIKGPPKRMVVALRGTEEWRDWLNSLGDHMSMPASVVIVQAVREYARAHGFDEPMPKR